MIFLDIHSLRSRCLELGSGGRKAGGVGGERARWRETRSLSLRVSPSRAPVFSFAHYFQAPATQARVFKTI